MVDSSESNGLETGSEDAKEQAAIRHKTVKQASDPRAVHSALKKISSFTRSPEEEQLLKEKLDRLAEKIARIKKQQESQRA